MSVPMVGIEIFVPFPSGSGREGRGATMPHRSIEPRHLEDGNLKSYWEESGLFLRTGFSPGGGVGSAEGFAGSPEAGVATSSPPPSE